MILICKVVENQNNDKKHKIIKLIAKDNFDKKNNEEIIESCDCQDFCEKLPEMFKTIINKTGGQNKIDKIILDFDETKNITTKRILMSFLCGYMQNTELVKQYL